MTTPVSIAIMASMTFILWRCLAKFPLHTEEHRTARLNYVNFGMALSFALVAFACLLYQFHQPSQNWLLPLCFVTWSSTVVFVIWQSRFHKALKVVSYAIIIGAPLLFFFYFRGQPNGGITGFLDKLDTFLVVGKGTPVSTPVRNGQANISSQTAPAMPGTSASEEGVLKDGGLKPSVFLQWVYYFVSTFAVLHFYGRMYESSYKDKLRRREIERGLQEGAVERSVMVLSVALSFFCALVFVGTELDKLGIFSGLLAAGVSIALRDLLANMAAGMLLLWEKSIKKGDVISMDDNRYGRVENMTMRYLVLQDRNEVQFFIPNSEFINKTIINWTHGNESKVRLKLDFGVAYGSDLDKIKEILGGICLKVGRVLRDPSPRVLVMGLGDSALNLQLRFFINDPHLGIRNVLSEIYEQLIVEFKRAEIVVPFPQHEIKIHSDHAAQPDSLEWSGRVFAPNRRKAPLAFILGTMKR